MNSTVRSSFAIGDYTIYMRVVAIGVLALTGCATANPVAINLPVTLKEPCPRAEVGPLETIGDLGALVVRQEAAVKVCDARREAVVSIVEGYNAATRPKRWPWSIR